MKILFLCGSAEPGKDGVGDYTRRLCAELIRTGHQVQILSLCDNQATNFVTQNQMIEALPVLVRRIPIASSTKQRAAWTQEVIDDEVPDWISLQYVPYSFNPKGLPFWLPFFLKKLKGNHKWHIMFHELWLGIDIESSFRHKCIGKLQQLIVIIIIKNLNPNQINTQNKLYQYHLKSITIDADILPICGNIPVTGVKNKMKKNTQFVLFGSIHHGAPFDDFIRDLVTNSYQFNYPIKFMFIGKNGSELSNYTNILDQYAMYYEVLGIQSENIISQVLYDSDYGLSTTPYFQTEKSGVYAAYREHQLNTICVSRKWTPKCGDYIIPNIIKYKKNDFKLIPMDVDILDLNQIAKQFINSIS
jgi:AAA+ ATPase superfamily predicted ATPase